MNASADPGYGGLTYANPDSYSKFLVYEASVSCSQTKHKIVVIILYSKYSI